MLKQSQPIITLVMPSIRMGNKQEEMIAATQKLISSL
jgi:hypothetical protein